MEAISFIALILLPLWAYSGSAVAKAGKNVELRPQVPDLIFVVLIIAWSLYTRMTIDLNKWILILLWMGLSGVTGLVVSVFWKLPKRSPQILAKERKNVTSVLKKWWAVWTDYSRRILDFQSRILLSLVFFLIVAPFTLAARIFSDRLNVKHQQMGSYWQLKKEEPLDIKQYGRQF